MPAAVIRLSDYRSAAWVDPIPQRPAYREPPKGEWRWVAVTLCAGSALAVGGLIGATLARWGLHMMGVL